MRDIPETTFSSILSKFTSPFSCEGSILKLASFVLEASKLEGVLLQALTLSFRIL